MTPQEERQYLCELIMSASEWRISEGDDTDALRLEIQDRLRRLNGIDTVDENGYAQSCAVDISPVITEDDYKTLDEHLASSEKVENAKERWKHGRVRVTIDGKPMWKLESECHKEIIPGFEKKWHWVWNGPSSSTVGENLPTKAEQEEAMWEEHEQSK